MDKAIMAGFWMGKAIFGFCPFKPLVKGSSPFTLTFVLSIALMRAE